jgi:VIT1/CCC1 family predicted Fe2+/Mn2+ transporter
VNGWRVFPVAAVLAAAALIVAGAVRATFVGKTVARSAVEMLSVGAIAAGAAFVVGRLASALLR